MGTMAAGQAIHGRGGITLPAPPDAQVTPVTDDYFGTKVVDNYRWLENAQQPGDQGFYRRRECVHGALTCSRRASARRLPTIWTNWST